MFNHLHLWDIIRSTFIMLYFSILLHCTGLTLELLCSLRATSFTILSSFFFIGHYMFWPNWPPSDVQVVMVKDPASHCNAVFFLLSYLPLVILVRWNARGRFWFCLVSLPTNT
jgi:hypothetical protein